MTETADTVRAERLARLRQRRAGTVESTDARPAVPAAAPISASLTPPHVHHEPPIAPIAATTQPRRRSAATTAKIVTVGASTTAVLGMMAGYGIADRAAADEPILVPAGDLSAPVPPSTVALASAPAATTSATAAPQVIVVVIDAATGQPITGDVDLSTITAATIPAAPATVPSTVPSTVPAPVAAPATVDLAVPAAPPPPAAPAPAAAPAPQPEATSGGS